MRDLTAFLAAGFRAAGDALADTAGRANLHLRPETLSRAMRRRCLSEFRALANLLRRLLFLMALSMDLPPVRHSPDKSGEVLPQSGLDDTGIEDVTASFGPRPQGFRLAPAKAGPPPDLSGGYRYLQLERMAYYVHKDTYRKAVRAAAERYR